MYYFISVISIEQQFLMLMYKSGYANIVYKCKLTQNIYVKKLIYKSGV